ncbi:hypothetical protein BRC94_04885 [Halobacteriales archaeon QS_5_70_17]|nr:MAG: hypothetical protein BRC94_04885 [Halobacteriales archaeon QS_5_70_17]
MSRRVPELALVTGVALGLPLALFVALFAGSPVSAAAVGLALCYPFAAYAVHYDEDPTTVLVPRWVLAAGAAAGALIVAVGALTGEAGAGVAVGSVAAVPALAYHARYGDPPAGLRRGTVLAAGGVVAAVAVLVGAALGGLVPAAVGAALTAVGAADYGERVGGRLPRQTERCAVAGCLGGGALAVVAGVPLGRPIAGIALGGGLLALGAFYALSAESRRGRGRRRR